MRVLCLTLHIGARDVQWCLEKLGHKCDIASYSGHSHIMGWDQREVDWTLGRVIEPGYRESWWNAHPQYHGYDMYIAFYEPSTVCLLLPSRKPCVMMCPVRYSYPFGERVEELNRVLLPAIDGGQLTVVANSRYDQECAADGLGRDVRLIESLCAYVGDAGYNGEKNGWVFDGRCQMPEVRGLRRKESALPNGHKWADIGKYSGFVMLPYNASQMSFYERLWLGMPHLLPSMQLLERFEKSGKALEQLHWFSSKQWRERSRTEWMDWYQYEGMLYFDDVKSLSRLIDETDCDAVSAELRKKNEQRERSVLSKWGEVCAKSKGWVE